MILSTVPKHNRTKFMFHRESRTYSTEASMLGRQWSGRVYDDACDDGFYIVRPDGQSLLVTCSKEVKIDGEIMQWEFVPTYEAIQKNPALTGVRFIVFND